MEPSDRNRDARPAASARRAWWLLGALALALAGFAAGRLSAPGPHSAPAQPDGQLLLVQQLQDPRELFPLPGPGQGFGLQPGEGECPLFLYQDGQLFRFDGQGLPGPFPGLPGSPELFPLEPVPAPPPLLGPSDMAGRAAPSLASHRAAARP